MKINKIDIMRVSINKPSIPIIIVRFDVEVFEDINWTLADPIAPVPMARVRRLKIEDLSFSEE